MRKYFWRRTKGASELSSRSKTLPLGIKAIHCPDHCDVDIVFIHGLSGNREKTWTGPGQTEPWLKTILPGRLPTARILVFGYDAKWLKDSSQNRVQEHASNLLASLGRYRDEDNTSTRLMIFALVLSEQQGGQRHLPSIHEQTIGIAFLGTPHQGSDLAPWAKALSRLLRAVKRTNSDITDVLHHDSEQLSRIQHSFHLMLQRRPERALPTINITYFFEELPMSRPLGVIVPKESATRPGCKSVGIHANHSNMTKFVDADDEGFLNVTGELRRWIEVAKQAGSNIRPGKGDRAPAPFIVPYTTNQNFIGRKDILRELELSFDLTEADRTWQPRVALYGLGGIGKTQIAIQFTYWLQRRYPDLAVYWVHASNADRFRQSYTSIAKECGIPGLEDPKNDVLPLVKDWLGKKDHGWWLMVVDNADDEDLFTTHQPNAASSTRSGGNLGAFIPDCANGSILITTRNRMAGSRLTKNKQLIEINKLDILECVSLFNSQLEKPASEESISKVSDKLGFIPLALVQAAAFIKENSISVDEYLGLLDEEMIKLLEEDFETVGRDEESLHAVAATWMISYQQIQKRDPLAGQLLSLMTFFDRQEIPRLFLLNYYKRHHDGKDGVLEVTKAIGRLQSFCLITEERGRSINIHRLVQLTTRRWLTNQHCEGDFEREAISTVSEMFPDAENVGNWPTCIAYLAHAQAVRHLKSPIRDREILRACLLMKIGWFFYEQGRLKKAEKASKEAETIRRDTLGEEHPDTLDSMSDLTSIFWAQGRLEEADQLGTKALELFQKILGEEHPKTLKSMGNLASILRDQGQLEEAAQLEVKLLDSRKRILGEEHPATLITMGNLAVTLKDQGRLEEAKQLEVKVLELSNRILGEEHPDTLRSIGNLAATFWEQGLFQEAEQLETNKLEICERVLGQRHPETLTTMSNLAHTWNSLGRESEAREMMIECIKLRKRVIGEDHYLTKDSIQTLESWCVQ
ncbi:unnamed protein product [Clonostachys rosea]|uniref:NB-ARC domain-containing protein n=1 Tax=Bionectria ochroleuca TaxID=29856 RepID=A0ABY6UP22_BIOOC|nr:unnamed protein product [Clonostachys rosea]